MTKDYKQAKLDAEPKTNYLWMISGMTIGLLVGLGMFFFSNPQVKVPVSNPTSTNEVNQILATTEQPSSSDPIAIVINESRNMQQNRKHATFTYFGVLPNLERDIQVKQDSQDKLAQETIAPEQEREASTGDYLLQIASFRKEQLAQKAQQELQSQGIGTHIEKTLIRGRNWFRIITVPTKLKSEIDRWARIIETKGHRPILIQL